MSLPIFRCFIPLQKVDYYYFISPPNTVLVRLLEDSR